MVVGVGTPESEDEFDAAWARIVEDLTVGRGSEDVAGPPVEESSAQSEPDAQPPEPGSPPPRPAPRPPPPEAATDPQAGLDALFAPLRARREPPTDSAADTWEDEGHFVPPPPPDIPEGTPVTRLAWAGLIGGPLVLLLIAFTGWQPPSIVTYGAGLACIAGFATLVWHLPEGREDGWDDGSRL